MPLPPNTSFLVVRSANIGDLVCTTPLISALRQTYPRARICALVNSYNAPVLEHNPDIDQIYAYTKLKHRIDGANIWRVLWDRVSLMAKLRHQHFDFAIVTGARFLPRGLRLARAVRPKHIIAFTETGRGSSAIDMPVLYEAARPMHEVEDIFRLLTPLGITTEPGEMRVVPDPEVVEQLKARIGSWGESTGKPLIGIHISARHVSNRWHADRYARLITELHARHGAAFMLFWSPGPENHPHHPGDDALAARVVTATRSVPLLPCATQRLEELIAGLSCCDPVICSDGGALHIAAALGKSMLCFFGDSDVTRWRPWKVPHVVIQPPSRSVSDISVEEALIGFERLLEKNHAADSRFIRTREA